MDRLTERNANGGIAVRDLPAALDKLAAYEDAEEQGRLVRLPCKVGDIVYFLHGNVVERSVVTAYYIAKHRKEFLLTKTKAYSAYYVPIEQMGKAVFLTRAEAETALQARKAAQQTDVGEWRESGDGFFRFCYCSRCGHKERRETSLPSLCPACGAQMKFRDDILKAIERGVKAAMKGGGA